MIYYFLQFILYKQTQFPSICKNNNNSTNVNNTIVFSTHCFFFSTLSYDLIKYYFAAALSLCTMSFPLVGALMEKSVCKIKRCYD